MASMRETALTSVQVSRLLGFAKRFYNLSIFGLIHFVATAAVKSGWGIGRYAVWETTPAIGATGWTFLTSLKRIGGGRRFRRYWLVC